MEMVQLAHTLSTTLRCGGKGRAYNWRLGIPMLDSLSIDYRYPSDSTINHKSEIINQNPGEIAKDFFSNPETQQTAINHLSERGYNAELVKKEVGKFILYWTEPNKSGKKVRWEQQNTFEIKRRLLSWFSNIKEKKGYSNVQTFVVD